VQRIPVRITLDPQELKQHPLRVGLSMTVSVDIHDTSGPVVSSQVRNLPQPTQDSAGDDPELQARIDRIVALNAGDAGHAEHTSVARAAGASVR
jgi:membrane fusion protein (multidrug efflux system)